MADEIEKVLDEKVVDVKSDYCEPLQKPKPKKNLTEKQKEIGRANLAKGRETLAIKRKQQKEEQQKTADEMIVKKAEKLIDEILFYCSKISYLSSQKRLL